ncbi:MAG: sigma-70 family RNA polymerase sigma factor [Actinomycetota bacterium]
MREGSDPVAVAAGVSFEDFYLKDYQAVVGLAYALSGSRWLAEDLAQEAFLAAHRNWPRISAYEQPGAWVRRVVANLSVSAVRRRVVEAKALVRLGVGERHRLPELPPDEAEFWEAVRSLPRRQSQVVALHYLEDLPVAEVAAILDMAPGTVKKHLFDGRRELARRLRAEEDQG